MFDSNLKKQMLIMAGLSALIREMWKVLTIKRKKQTLAQRIELLKERVSKIKSGDLNIVDVINDAQINDKLARSAR